MLTAGCVFPGDLSTRDLVVQGRVLGKDGTPISGAEVKLVQPERIPDRADFAVIGSSDGVPDRYVRRAYLVTGLDGCFRCEFSGYLRPEPVWIVPPISLVQRPQSYVLWRLGKDHKNFYAVRYPESGTGACGYRVVGDQLERLNAKETHLSVTKTEANGTNVVTLTITQ